MTGEPLLTIHVDCEQPLIVRGNTRDVVMIPFSGTASGELFSGTVEPGGIDTQKIPKGGEVFLSARYMLKGTDRDGRSCRIFIENQGSDTLGFTPVVVTDSPLLADWETIPLTSTLEGIPGGVIVRIWKQ